MYCKYLNVCTYRKHFEDLQPIRGPAFFGFVDWQREVYISGILREKQHKEDSPKDRNKHIMYYFLYCTFLGKIINSVGSCFSFSCLCLTGTPEGQSQSISQTASEGANQWQLQAHILSLWSERRGPPANLNVNNHDTARSGVKQQEYHSFELPP